MEQRNSDQIFMKRCLELARMGADRVYSNPMVGAVLVHKNKIVAEGYHEYFGGPHAEVNAIKAIKNKHLLKECTLFVSLEPCSHYGKTPPCVNLVIESQIPHVIIGTSDPNPLVAGRGIEMLKESGIQVKTGILKAECEWLNRRFFAFHKEKRTYVVLKWAESADGFIDTFRSNETPIGPRWITNEPARQLVHKWRSREIAIMAGTNTIFFDNPQLNVREWPGRNPIRVVIDRSLRLPGECNVFDQSIPTMVFTEKEKKNKKNLDYYRVDFSKNLPEEILSVLFKKGIQSVFIEGGGKVLQSFIDAGRWDEARVFRGKDSFHRGIKAPILKDYFAPEEENLGNSLFSLYIQRKF